MDNFLEYNKFDFSAVCVRSLSCVSKEIVPADFGASSRAR